MASLNTTEAVTRHLRSKNLSPQDAYTASRNLINGSYPVYLPNATQFLFELLCDRMGDLGSGVFAQWKKNPQLWRLWRETYQKLSACGDESRDAIFSRVKLLQIMCAVLDARVETASAPGGPKKQRVDTVDEDTVQEMFSCVQYVTTHGYVAVDDYVAVGLLASYCRYMQAFPVDLAWTVAVKTLFDLPHQYISYRPGKQSLNRYFSQVVPPQLALLERTDESVAIMHSIFCTFLFSYTTDAGLVSHVTSLVQSHALSDAGAVRLFRETIVNLAASEIATCETVYRALVSGSYAHLASELLTVLAKVNRTLSPGFYETVHADALAAEPVDWRLVSHIMALHPVLYAGWKVVVDGAGAAPSAVLLEVARNLVAAFSGARELPVFVNEVYPYCVQYAGWTDARLMDQLAPTLAGLSKRAFLEAAQKLLETRAEKPMALLVRALAQSPAHNIEWCRAFFSDAVPKMEGWSEVLYQLVMLYPVAESVAKLQVQTHSDYDVFLLFRLSELGEKQEPLHANLRKFIARLDRENLAFFVQRWLVLVEQKCAEVYPDFFSQMLRIWSSQEVMDFLRDQEMQVCEMGNFLRAFSAYLQENRPPVMYDVLRFLPRVVFRKFFSPFVEIMVQDAMEPENDAKTAEKATTARQTLAVLLQEPNLSSSIEKSFDLLLKFVEMSPVEAHDADMQTAQRIWAAHLRNIKEPTSAKFVKSAIKKMDKMIAKEEKNFHKNKASDPSRLLSVHGFLCVPTNKVDLAEPTARLVKYMCSTITDQNFEKRLELLDKLPCEGSQSEIGTALRQFGAFPASEKTKTVMFSLASKTAGQAKASYVLALFLVLRSEIPGARVDLQNSLRAYLRQFSEPEFETSFRATLAAVNTHSGFLAAIFDALAAFCSLIPKERSYAGLVAASVSGYLAHAEQLDETSSVAFLATLTDLVAASGSMTPHVVELLLSAACRTAGQSEPAYAAAAKLVTYAVNAHRGKLRGRYHVIVHVMSELMAPLTEAAELSQAGRAVDCARSYARLLTTLCEPPVQTTHNDSLTSSVAVYRKALRSHAHVILVNYINLRLGKTFSPETNEALMPGLFSLVGLFSSVELELVSSCLDMSGRTYFQSLYASYRDHGKWRE